MKIISILTALCFSLTTHAQIEFGPLIEQSITQQEDLAAQIKYGPKTAENTANTDEDPEFSAKDNVRTIKTSEATVSEANRAPASAPKDFSVSLHSTTAKAEPPATGRASAARYFPYVPKPKRSAHYKKSKVKATVKTARAKKNKSGRSTASVGKKKSKKSKKAT